MADKKTHIYVAEHPLTGEPTERLIRGKNSAQVENFIRGDLIKVRRATTDDMARLLPKGVTVEELAAETPNPTLPLPQE